MTDGVAVRRAGRFGPRGPARTISRAVGLAVVMFEAVAAFWLVMLLRTSDLVPSDPPAQESGAVIRLSCGC